MNRRYFINLCLAVTVAVTSLATGPAFAAAPVTGPGDTPDYYETPNWANSPPLRKFVDTLPGLNAGAKNNLNQYIPVAIPDTISYPGSDYYELELGQYSEKMHSDLPPTTLRGYRQTNTADAGVRQFHYLGPLIVAQKDRPVRVKFTNSLGTGAAGDLFLPVDTTIMGSGEFEIDYDPATKSPTGMVTGVFAQNRALLHLHGGRTPWISDGTPHQWITPKGEITAYPKGVSVVDVPDMWFDAATGETIASCAGAASCSVAGVTATNNPGAGSQTYYWTNQQSARLMFFHDHSSGITRLNVYAGEAAGYLIQDPVEQALVNGGTVNGRVFAAGTIPVDQIPLIIQDKTFVDADPTRATYVRATDPTWNWGSGPLAAQPNAAGVVERAPSTGDLWWPHVYMPAENPFNPDMSGMNMFGRWFYGPWFYPATPICGVDGAALPLCITHGTIPNPYYDETCDPAVAGFCQPPEIPGTPSVSWGAEAFLDTMTVNGTAYPTVTVDPKAYRLRILNAAHDRFLNLQLYQADAAVAPGCPTCASGTEVRMVPALDYAPENPNWPADAREGGVPDPALRGPALIQIGSEGGLLPAPVLLPNQPVSWNLDPTTFDFGNVNGGTLIMGPAERADVIVDFSKYAGRTLILYNDAPTAFPALVPQYNYYTGAPDRTDVGGIASTPVGFGPNVRTVMQIKVSGSGGSAPPDDFNPAILTRLQDAFKTTSSEPGAFSLGQEPVIVAQSSYNSAYNTLFPASWPNWGLSRITDTSISFKQPDGQLFTNYPMIPKAIHDEMGASFDEFGRMAAKLGLELPFTTAGNANFLLQNYVDPPTEIVKPGAVQIWKISHNGVDAHPVHFHLFDVQLINRVAWDGAIRLPDANELGWKDTIRINPLQDTIVALRPIVPVVPFPLPDSIRPLNPAAPIGSEMGFSQTDPKSGGNLVGGSEMVNQLYNFGHEYVWHCHILSHEENDMMRPLSLLVPPAAPSTLTASVSGADVVLSFLDHSASETSFNLQISNDPTFQAAVTTRAIASSSPGSASGGIITATVDPALGAYYRVQAIDDYTPGAPASYSPNWSAQQSSSRWSNLATVNQIPIAIAEPAALAFGNQPVGTTSLSRTVILSNQGAGVLNISGITLAGVNPGDWAILSNSCGTTLTPAQTCSVRLAFTPTAAAALAASLAFATDDPVNPALAVSLTGSGITAPLAGIAPALLSFSPQLVNTTSPVQTVALSNSGNAPLNVINIALTGANFADFGLAHDCVSPLAPGAACTLSVTSTPRSAGTLLASLAISGDLGNPTLSVPLSATGIAPAATVTPNALSFAGQMVKTTSTAQFVVLSNTGNAPLSLNGFAFNGAAAGDFAQSNDCVFPLAAGGNCTVSVTFTPAAAAGRTASLAVATSDPVTPTLNVAVSGSGVAPVGSIAPAALAFGSILVNTTSTTQTLTLSNTSTSTALAINSITVEGANAADFLQTSGCGTSLAPGATCTVEVSFHPSLEGNRSALLSVSSNDPLNGSPLGTFSVPLSGLGSTITLSSQALFFGAQVLYTTSSSQMISILNTSSAPMNISNVTLSGANPADFTQTNNCPTNLGAGRACSINVRFTPKGAGTRLATMSIFDSAAGSPQSVPLSGTGLLGPAAVISPTSVNFGNVRRGSTSAAQTVTLSSNGGVGLKISSISLGGASSNDFSLTNNNCPIGGAGLAAGVTCTVSVSFRPARRTGTRTATVVFADNANNVNSNQNVVLKGVAQ